MRYSWIVFLLLLLFNPLNADTALESFVQECQTNSKLNANICSCSYKLFTRRYDKKLIHTPKREKELQKYTQACQNIDEKMHVYTYNRLEQLINNGRYVGWENLNANQRGKMIHIINESRRLYFKACQAGFETGCYNVARLYSDGLTKDVDKEKAKEYLQKACVNGFEAVCRQKVD